LNPIAETEPTPRLAQFASGILRAARRGQSGEKRCEEKSMFVAATAPASAVVFLFALSFLCFMSAAALRRWP